MSGTFMFALSAVFFLCQPANAQESWVFKQVHRTYGPLEVLIAPNGTRVNCGKNGVVFTCNAPKWEMILYNKARKCVCIKKYEDWSKASIKTSLNIQNNDTFFNWPRVLVAKVKRFGVNAKIYAFPARLSNGGPANLKHGKFAELTVTDGLKIEPHVERFLQSLMDVPPEKGIPIRFWKIGKSNGYGLDLKYNNLEERHSTIETLSIKPTTTRPNTAPDPATSGYKLVAESTVTVDEEEMHDMYTNLMSDEPAFSDGGKPKSTRPRK